MKNNITIVSSLYKKYVNDLFSYGVGMGFTDEVCKDAIHDVFCNLYTNDTKLEEIANAKYYLFRSLKNRLIDIYRSTQKMETVATVELPFTIEVSIQDSIIAEDEEKILKANVKRLMDQLTDRQHEAIYLRYMQELSYDEIGLLLDMTSESVRKLVHRGIEKMRVYAKNDEKLLVLLIMLILLG